MLAATAATLAAAGVAERPGTLLAGCGDWTIANLPQLPGAPELLIPPAKPGRQGKPRKDGKPSASRSDGLRTAVAAKLQSEDGKARCAKRKQSVEPVFGQVKDVRGARRFLRRGLGACAAEWPPPEPASRHGTVFRRTTSAASRRGMPRFARPPTPCSRCL